MEYTLSEQQIIANMAVDWSDDDFNTVTSSLQLAQPMVLNHADATTQTSVMGTIEPVNFVDNPHEECIPKQNLFGLSKNQLHPLLANQPKIWSPRTMDDFDMIGSLLCKLYLTNKQVNFLFFSRQLLQAMVRSTYVVGPDEYGRFN